MCWRKCKRNKHFLLMIAQKCIAASCQSALTFARSSSLSVPAIASDAEISDAVVARRGIKTPTLKASGAHPKDRSKFI